MNSLHRFNFKHEFPTYSAFGKPVRTLNSQSYKQEIFFQFKLSFSYVFLASPPLPILTGSSYGETG